MQSITISFRVNLKDNKTLLLRWHKEIENDRADRIKGNGSFMLAFMQSIPRKLNVSIIKWETILKSLREKQTYFLHNLHMKYKKQERIWHIWNIRNSNIANVSQATVQCISSKLIPCFWPIFNRFLKPNFYILGKWELKLTVFMSKFNLTYWKYLFYFSYHR